MQDIVTSKQKYFILCSDTVKEPVSSHIRVYPTPFHYIGAMTRTGFEYLKTCLTEAPILKYPNPHKRYILFTDASDQAAAAVLTQEYSDKMHTSQHSSLIHNLNGAQL